MVHAFAAYLFLGLMVLGRASSLSMDSRQLSSKTSQPISGGAARISGARDVSGLFLFSSVQGSDWVSLNITMRGLLQYNRQAEGFAFHVHEHPVVNGDCASTLGHYKVLKTKPSCNSQVANYCQPAELALRHGNLPGNMNAFSWRLYDNAVELTGPDSIVGRSIVVHGANMSRIACGNIASWTLGTKV
ncbi:hypothetical protein PCANC_12860 [Puccinia coronata f. sp. avenae]|uniref:Superoxide dismutase copper/zinc binding domain-containing protein n=1 Tax=Puccinia coronata f. sp. avenae TaxID=200324 RepID=A0A2N5SPP6_9BASI|nr:hypothetical protein PCANC_12860 [Puccinia coronata f. sp. avenae]